MAKKVSPLAMCTYRIQKGKESRFQKLLLGHWPMLRKEGLVTVTRPQIFRGVDESGKTFFVEILEWKDGRTPERAHELPVVMFYWEPMGKLTESRLGRQGMEFPHVEKVSKHARTKRS